MAKVRFLAAVAGDSQNRAGWNVGDEVWMSDAEAAQRLERAEVEVIEDDPRPDANADAQAAPAPEA